MTNDTIEYTGSAILGAVFSTAVFWTLGKAFLVGIAGAAGGLFLKFLVKQVSKRIFPKDPDE